MNYLDKDFAKVYDDGKHKDTVVLEWGEIFQTKAFIQEAVNAVLDAVKTQKKTKLLALIKAKSYENSGLEWLVAEWYTTAYAAGLKKIAHLMGAKALAEIAAEKVSTMDKSGMLFFNTSNVDEAYTWLNS
ncbi:MAG TPA: hypothetical protein PL048_19875 [Leptospiraceae bacterium]|nr:hypothetical protein [Leptospiraceae bacterium]HMY68218.1 hypothetical protein [Leptospiraceae bacterium]HMZ61046.1 hypothetical protein [Leptospiraceae bacterium]HNF14765.1 hypothetical protein [Leptospiraceae bacterium]HNF24141.1 hypothetical protein [Leptospiraceae bacterium]